MLRQNCLLQQILVVTNMCCSDKYCSDKYVFVTTNIILRRQKFCRDKHFFVVTKDVFCCEKTKTFVATKTVLVVALTNDSTLHELQLHYAKQQGHHSCTELK